MEKKTNQPELQTENKRVSLSIAQPGFQSRRMLNFCVIGFTYASIYFGRYNLSISNPLLSEAYGWSKVQIGNLITTSLLSYGFFAAVNGFITDQMGGRRSLLFGIAGTILCNFFFGMGKYFSFLGTGELLLGYMTVVWVMNACFQSLCLVSMVKINASWLRVQERGRFGALFAMMLQTGRLAILSFGPMIAVFWGWSWLFFIPSIIISLMGICAYFVVQESPEKCGFERWVADTLPSANAAMGGKRDELQGKKKSRTFNPVVLQLLKQPVICIIALSEFCLGFVRHGFEQWFPRYLLEVHSVPMTSSLFVHSMIGVVVAGMTGSFVAGWVSDKIFVGRRAPVAACGYFFQILSLALIWKVDHLWLLSFAFFMQPFATSMIQSTLSATASMDFGGRQAAASAIGIFNAMNYLGGSLVGLGMGWILQHWGWNFWAVSMIGFAGFGLFLMTRIWRARAAS